jgi:hypothetical protein
MRGLTLLATMALGAMITTGGLGCKGGGDGKPKEGEGGKKVTVTAPGATDIKPEGTAKVTVKIERTKFDEDVTVKINDLPKGVTAEGGKIEKGKTEGTFELKAAKDAEGEKEAKVMVEGGGASDTGKFKVTVKK